MTTIAYTLDQNGNQTAKTNNGVTTTMVLGSRTAENKLTALTDGSTLSFTYNGDGLRQSKTADGVTTRFVYSGVRLLQETNATGTTDSVADGVEVLFEWIPSSRVSVA